MISENDKWYEAYVSPEVTESIYKAQQQCTEEGYSQWGGQIVVHDPHNRLVDGQSIRFKDILVVQVNGQHGKN